MWLKIDPVNVDTRYHKSLSHKDVGSKSCEQEDSEVLMNFHSLTVNFRTKLGCVTFGFWVSYFHVICLKYFYFLCVPKFIAFIYNIQSQQMFTMLINVDGGLINFSYQDSVPSWLLGYREREDLIHVCMGEAGVLSYAIVWHNE